MNLFFKLVRHTLFAMLVIFTLLHSQEKRLIAILPFTNGGSQEHAWVARGIEEILYDKLSNLRPVNVFEKETLLRILAKKKINSLSDLNARKAFSIGKETGADVLIAGSYKVVSGKLLLKFRVISTYTGADIFNQTFSGPLEKIFQMHTKALLEILNIMALPLTEKDRQVLSRTSTNSITAFESYCKAYVAFQRGASMETVASLFNRALQQDPDFWEAQYNLGVIYYNFDKYNKALNQFRNVIQRNPSFYKPHYGMGVIYYLQRNYRGAIRQFNKVLELQPDHDRTLYYLGRVYVRMDSIEKGLKYLDKAAKINPNYAPTQYQIAQANMRRGWYKTAVQALKKAIKLNPGNAKAHNALGECYYRLQRFDEAIIEYKKAIELRKNYSTAYFNLGNTIYKKGALEEIVSAYLEILETRYAEMSAKGEGKSIAEGLQKLKNKEMGKSTTVYKKMIRSYRKALEYEPGFFEASYNLALTYENIGKIDSAEYFYKVTIQHRPTLVRAHMRLGHLYEKEKKYNEALKHFKEVVKIEPSYFADTPRLGEEYRYINIIEEVLKEYQLKSELNPRDPQTLLVLARIFNSLGRYGQAEQYYKQIVQIDPQNSEANRALKNLKRQMRKL